MANKAKKLMKKMKQPYISKDELEKMQRRKTQNKIIIALVIALLSVWFINFCIDVGNGIEEMKAEQNESDTENDSTATASNISTDANNNILIAKSSIEVGKPQLIDYNGTYNIIVLKTSSGDYKTAFDMHPDCYHYGDTSFGYDNGTFVCNTCGLTVTESAFGLANFAGDLPVAIPSSYREDTTTDVVIPYEVVVYFESMLKAWDDEGYTEGQEYSTNMGQYSKEMVDEELEKAASETTEDSTEETKRDTFDINSLDEESRSSSSSTSTNIGNIGDLNTSKNGATMDREEIDAMAEEMENSSSKTESEASN